MSEYAVLMSLLSNAASVAVPGLSFTWRMNLPVPCRIRQRRVVKEPHVYVRSENICVAITLVTIRSTRSFTRRKT